MEQMWWLIFWAIDLLGPLLGYETASIIGFFWGPMAIALLVQLGMLWLARDRWKPLRFVGLLLLAPPIIAAFYAWQDGTGWWEVSVFFCLIVALAFLIGWGVAWPIFRHSRRKKKDEN